MSGGLVTIKKYANRRLYNTATSSYVTLDTLCQMVKDNIDFVVYDAKTGEDITRSVLTQIIVEEESKGQNLLPISFLRQLIGFYGDNLQMVVPRYLDYAMNAFSQNQDRTRSYMQEALGGLFPLGHFEEMSRQNMAMFEKTMQMFAPYGAAPPTGEGDGSTPAAPDEGTAPAPTSDEAIRLLQEQMRQLQVQLERMSPPAGQKPKDEG